MRPFERWLVHIGTLLVGGTGLVYAFMLYWLEPADPYSVLHHPLQGAVQHGHVLAAPLFVFASGLIFREHVWRGFRLGARERRSSGLAMLATLVPMIASGYLLQTASEPSWRRIWMILHLVASALWLAGYGGHWLARWRSARGRHFAR